MVGVTTPISLTPYMDKATFDPYSLITADGTRISVSLSDTVIYTDNTPHPETNPTAITVCQTVAVATAMEAGSGYRVSFEGKRSNAAVVAYVYWYINAVVDGGSESINVGADTYKAFTRDLAGVDPSDDLSVRVQEAGGGNVITIKDFRIKGTRVKQYTGAWS